MGYSTIGVIWVMDPSCFGRLNSVVLLLVESCMVQIAVDLLLYSGSWSMDFPLLSWKRKAGQIAVDLLLISGSWRC
ncbi:hypothetical protein Nepgr_007903 [Nepenthes gracilis]|uniref:Uncharacterized protein n=1 Tax=Nepenthes gracilis TaxID=150966 RepID=A0AAD3S7Q2_NEPGR|nr:hypothetical protein Nepgr_007903 [Nepenthes gracilis]